MRLNLIILITTGFFSSCSCQQGESNNSNVELQEIKIEQVKSSISMNDVKVEEKFTEYNDSLRCNIDFIVKLSNVMNNPSDKDILNFLYTFDESCNNNVEYLEFSNEILFQSLYEHPQQVLKLLSHKNVNINLILEELKTPINDKYNIKDIIREVNKADESEMKDKVKKSLSLVP